MTTSSRAPELQFDQLGLSTPAHHTTTDPPTTVFPLVVTTLVVDFGPLLVQFDDMAILRASAVQATLGRTVLRRAATQTRTQAWRQVGRRQYATQHGQKSSELPWMIASVGFTVPAAVWLFQQGPKKGVHHPEAAHEERKEGAKDQKQPAEESHEAKAGEVAPSKEEGKEPEVEETSTKQPAPDQGGDQESQSDSDQSKEDGSDGSSGESKEESDSKGDGGQSARKMSDDGYELPGPNAPGQINYKSSSDKGPGEGQKGPRPRSERQDEKDSQKDRSYAKNPYIEQSKDEKSKKGEGVTETAKIHGTVDPSRPVR